MTLRSSSYAVTFLENGLIMVYFWDIAHLLSMLVTRRIPTCVCVCVCELQ